LADRRRHAGVSAPSSTAIDLSRLPAPSFAAPQTYETILAEMVARMVALMPEFDATVDSDPAVKVLQVAAWCVMLERQRANDNALKVMLAYSEDADLDQLGANFNVERLIVDPGDPESGVDPTYESNAAFRERIQLSPESFSVAGPGTAYEFHARSVDASIVDARASSPAPGVVLICLLSRDGNGAADAEQIAEVEELLGNDAGALRPLTDNVLVQSAEIVPFEIEAALTLFDGPDESLVLSQAQARLAAYQARSRRIGRDVTRFGILAALGVEGVSNINLVKPAADVPISDTQCSNCVGSVVTVAGRGE
jgi:phage-related baseplate assembly protein